MKRVLENHLFLWKLCFQTAPGYMIYVLFDAFRFQFILFLEHTICIGYVLHCAEYNEPFYKAALMIGGVLLLSMTIMVPDGYFIHGATPRTKPKLYKALKEPLYKKAAEIDLSCYDDPNYYNEFVLAVSEAETSIDRFITLLNTSIQGITVVLTTGVLYLLTDSVGVLFVFASFILNFFVAKVVNKLNYEVRLKVNPQERQRNYVSRVFYLNDYAKELRLHPKTGELLDEMFDDANDKIIEEQRKVAKKRTGLLFAQGYLTGDFIMDGLYVAYLIFQAVVLKSLDYSTAVILFNRTGSLRRGMRQIAEIGPKAIENSMYVDKIRAFLDYEPVMKHGVGSNVPEEIGELCLEHVSFSYNKRSKEVLHDISLNVKKGEKIAIVGYNGAGKTTLIKLLMRLYDPTDGRILYHGKDIKGYDLDNYHRRISAVFQDYKMYGAPLLENVVLEDVEATTEVEERTVDALRQSGFAERLGTLEKGLLTPITTEFDDKGVNLSGGESQKVAVARAFYRQADILIMDEPSSALDPIAEYNLNAAMHEAARNKTVFYISHRLSTTRDADRIIMLEHGRIVEEGTHLQLLRKNGQYAKMWKVQAGRYN